jgi:hypothetical protein
MKVIWRGGTLRGGMAQWALFGAVAVVVGLVAFVFVAFGLVVGVVLAGIFSVGAALASRRRAGGASAYGGRTASDGSEAEGHCVELGGDAYTIRIVEEEKPPARAVAKHSSPSRADES